MSIAAALGYRLGRRDGQPNLRRDHGLDGGI